MRGGGEAGCIGRRLSQVQYSTVRSSVEVFVMCSWLFWADVTLNRTKC